MGDHHDILGTYTERDQSLDCAPPALYSLFFSADMESPNFALPALHNILRTEVTDHWYRKATKFGLGEMMRAVESCFSYARFIIQQASDMNKVNILLLNDILIQTKLIEKRLKSMGWFRSLCSERARRTNAYCKAIKSALLEVDQIIEATASASGQNPELLDEWTPFFRSRLELTTPEKDFMTGLWNTRRHAKSTSPLHILQDLCFLFRTSPPQDVICTDANIDTTFLSVTHVMRDVLRRDEIYEQTTEIWGISEKIIILVREMEALHWSDIEEATLSNDRGYIDHCFERRNFFLTTLCKLWLVLVGPYVHPVIDAPRPCAIMETKPSSRNFLASPLWFKLFKVQSTRVLVKLSGSSICLLCLVEMAQVADYAILESCFHLFCIPCVERFHRSSRCPHCLKWVFTWTTGAHFEAFKDNERKRVRFL